MRLLFLGDVVGEPGRKAVIERLPELRAGRGIDFVVLNGENSAGGRGITPKISISLLRAGAAVITLGDHAWDQKEIVPYNGDRAALAPAVELSGWCPRPGLGRAGGREGEGGESSTPRGARS